jgi:hypothetical protein
MDSKETSTPISPYVTIEDGVPNTWPCQSPGTTIADGVRDLHSISEEIELFHQREIHTELINNTW